jgi:hypothetical protein
MGTELFGQMAIDYYAAGGKSPTIREKLTGDLNAFTKRITDKVDLARSAADKVKLWYGNYRSTAEEVRAFSSALNTPRRTSLLPGVPDLDNPAPQPMDDYNRKFYASLNPVGSRVDSASYALGRAARRMYDAIAPKREQSGATLSAALQQGFGGAAPARRFVPDAFFDEESMISSLIKRARQADAGFSPSPEPVGLVPAAVQHMRFAGGASQAFHDYLRSTAKPDENLNFSPLSFSADQLAAATAATPRGLVGERRLGMTQEELDLSFMHLAAVQENRAQGDWRYRAVQTSGSTTAFQVSPAVLRMASEEFGVPGRGTAAALGFFEAEALASSRELNEKWGGINPLIRTQMMEEGAARARMRNFNLDQATISRILAVPKGQRPDPSTYMPAGLISQHLGHLEGGVSFLMPEAALDRYGRASLGRPDNTTFVISTRDMDRIVARSRGNGGMHYVMDQLGIPPEAGWDKKVMKRIDVPNPRSLGLRMATGNEGGVNAEWISGGNLPTGVREAVLSERIPQTAYGEFPWDMLDRKLGLGV